MTDALQRLLDTLTVFLAENPLVGAWYTTVVRFVFPLLALMILVGAIRSLWKVKHPDEVWGYLGMANGVRLPITHWENIIGRAPACDVQLEYPSVSRQHAALIREDDGSWTVYDLGSKGGVKVNDLPVDEYAVVEDGDTLSFGGIPTMLVPISAEEKREQMAERRVEGRPAGMWGSLVLLTLFQVLTALQLIVAAGENASVTVPLTFLTFTAVCWGYFIVLRSFRRIGFEMETIAFFLCTLSLAVTGSTVPDECPKQLVAILMGLAIFLVLGFFLRDLTRAQRVRWIMGAAAVGMLVITLLIGSSEGGAKAWTGWAACRSSPPRAGQNLLYLRGRGHTRPPVQQAQPVAVHRPDRHLRRVSGAAERLRHRAGVFRHLPGHRLPALGRLRDARPDLRGLLRRRHGVVDRQGACCGALCLLGPYLGGCVRRGLPADPHADRRCFRRHDRRGRGQGLALRSGRGGHGYCVRHAVRGVGAGNRCADRAVHHHAGCVAVRACRAGRSSFYTIAACAATACSCSRPA